jgi:hypothetical protein
VRVLKGEDLIMSLIQARLANSLEILIKCSFRKRGPILDRLEGLILGPCDTPTTLDILFTIKREEDRRSIREITFLSELKYKIRASAEVRAQKTDK